VRLLRDVGTRGNPNFRRVSQGCSSRRDPLPQRPHGEVTAVISVFLYLALALAVTLL
jgi:hypothetical protein